MPNEGPVYSSHSCHLYPSSIIIKLVWSVRKETDLTRLQEESRESRKASGGQGTSPSLEAIGGAGGLERTSCDSARTNWRLCWCNSAWGGRRWERSDSHNWDSLVSRRQRVCLAGNGDNGWLRAVCCQVRDSLGRPGWGFGLCERARALRDCQSGGRGDRPGVVACENIR